MAGSQANGGGGMSRAAKKRARKKKDKNKPQQQKQKREEKAMDESIEQVKGEETLKRKADETTTNKKQKKNRQNKKQKKAKKAKESTVEAEGGGGGGGGGGREDVDPVNRMVEEAVSNLTPKQILMHEPIEKESSIITIGTEEVDMNELVQEVTTRQRARCLFQSILGTGMSLEEFYDQYWEKEPLLVQADDNDEKKKFNGFLSLASIRQLLKDHPMSYGKDLNVTRYEQGIDGVKRRLTLDQTNDSNGGEYVVADPKDVWANFDEGCTVRLLCPHQHNDAIHSLLSTLETEWGCMVGANAYLTPPSESQGFAPHYDDIEAFILQLEGRKHWKVYEPLKKSEILPRVSSVDYTEEDLKDAEPALDVVLGPGDLLYMPRGWIHQACTLPTTKEHSLHLTVSAMQQWAWVDFLELLMPEALEAATNNEASTSLREGLPRKFLDFMGAAYDEPDDPDEMKVMTKKKKNEDNREESRGEAARGDAEGEDDEEKNRKEAKNRLREAFLEEAKKRIMRVTKEAMSLVDAACDQMGKRFLSDRLPPAFTLAESRHTSEQRSENGGKVLPNTMCRLARPGIARLVLEDGKAVLYHCVDNSRVYHGNPLSPVEFEMDDAPALEMLLATEEPRWIMVQDLIHDDIEDKMEIAQSLYDEGILAILQTENPGKREG